MVEYTCNTPSWLKSINPTTPPNFGSDFSCKLYVVGRDLGEFRVGDESHITYIFALGFTHTLDT